MKVREEHVEFASRVHLANGFSWIEAKASLTLEIEDGDDAEVQLQTALASCKATVKLNLTQRQQAIEEAEGKGKTEIRREPSEGAPPWPARPITKSQKTLDEEASAFQVPPAIAQAQDEAKAARGGS